MAESRRCALQALFGPGRDEMVNHTVDVVAWQDAAARPAAAGNGKFLF